MPGPDPAPSVERLVLGTEDPAAVTLAMHRAVAAQLCCEVDLTEWGETSTGVVRALRLRDGRRVVAKLHQPRERPARLAAVQAIQARLHAAGFPCPQPLGAPVALGDGTLTIETTLDAGELADGHEPAVRGALAWGLAEHLRIVAGRPAPAALTGDWTLYSPGALWPKTAHSPAFDLASTAAGAEWIDALALRARRVVDPTAAPVAGHGDWNARHVRFDGARIAAAHDWDSLSLRPESVLVGIAAVTFPARFDLPGVDRAASPEELDAFLGEYGEARGRPLDGTEREQACANATFVAAYTARCEHAIGIGIEDPHSFTAALARHGTDYLRL